ncbi:MAG: hypothetical protein JO157_01420 [Acetobacteraceae bacterium]|nr:hypothetical protein [Acetobacteraceae bacterium]
MADLRTHGPSVFERFRAGREGTLWYYRSLADAFARLLPGSLARDLDGEVAVMEAPAVTAADASVHSLP